MRTVLGFLAATALLAQAPLLSPHSEFDLVPSTKTPFKGEIVGSYFRAGPAGLTFIEIGRKSVSLTSADPNGKIVFSTRKLDSVAMPAVKAVFPSDGSIWFVSSPTPVGLDEDRAVTNVMNSFTPPRINVAAQGVEANSEFESSAFGYGPFSLELARYSPMGKRLESLHFVRPAGVLSQNLAAASAGVVVLRTLGTPVGASRSEGLQFGTVEHGKFKQSVAFHLDPPVMNAIPVLLANGNLFLISRNTGNIEVIDPNLKKGSLLRLPSPSPVRAAAAAGNYLYLLLPDGVLKMSLSGQAIATFRFQLGGGFMPAFIGVIDNSIYLADRHGHVEQFEAS